MVSEIELSKMLALNKYADVEELLKITKTHESFARTSNWSNRPERPNERGKFAEAAGQSPRDNPQ